MHCNAHENSNAEKPKGSPDKFLRCSIDSVRTDAYIFYLTRGSC
jgi:hypothetical protein